MNVHATFRHIGVFYKGFTHFVHCGVISKSTLKCQAKKKKLPETFTVTYQTLKYGKHETCVIEDSKFTRNSDIFILSPCCMLIEFHSQKHLSGVFGC